MWIILALSLLSGLSTPLGAVIVLSFRSLSHATLSFILAVASGVMVSVVITELMPNSIHSGGLVWFVVGCGTGMTLMVALTYRGDFTESPALISSVSRLRRTGESIALAIALHDLPEGMAIGAGDMVQAKLGLIIALAIALHNIPEGMSIAAPLSMGSVSRRRILVLTGLISLITPIGTLLSLMFGHLSHSLSSFILALASGVMLYVVAHDTFPASWKANKNATIFGIAAGAVLMFSIARIPIS